MTRKDYIALARAIEAARESLPDGRPPATVDELAYEFGRDQTARFIADVLEADDIRFNRDRFLEACGLIP